MRHVPVCLFLFAVSMLGASAASAEQFSFHVGLGVAGELDKRGPFDFGSGPNADAETPLALMVGIDVRSQFGAEALYVDLGRLRGSGAADAGFDVDGDLWAVGATYATSFNSIEPYAKLGWFIRNESGELITIGGPRAFDLSDDGWMGEAGLRWLAGPMISLRLGYVHYDFKPIADGSLQLALEWQARNP